MLPEVSHRGTIDNMPNLANDVSNLLNAFQLSVCSPSFVHPQISFDTIREMLASGKEVLLSGACHLLMGQYTLIYILAITMILWRRLEGNITSCPLTDRSAVAALFSQ